MPGRFLGLFKPIGRVLPEVKKPERKVSFNEKIFWTALVLVIFLVMTQIPLYGVAASAQDQFSSLRVIFASTRGTLMELGIGPIVAAGLILQLLAGSNIIECDMSNSEDRGLFTSASKVFTVVLTGIQGAAYIISGMYGALSGPVALVIFFQLIATGVIVMLMDELVQKGWGLGSGISLFIMAGVAQSVVWDMFSPQTGLFVGSLSAYLAKVSPFNVGNATLTYAFGSANGVYPSVLGFFATIGVRLLQGRNFTVMETENRLAPPVAIIDARMAKRLFPDGHALGRRIRYATPPADGTPAEMEIVGIVAEHRHQPRVGEAEPRLYVPLAHSSSVSAFIVARCAVDQRPFVAATMAALRRDLRAFDPDLPILRLAPFADLVEGNISLWGIRLGAVVFGAFGGIALLLAVVGVYGVKAYAVARRTREIGIRMALGAMPANVFALIMKQGAQQIAFAVFAGVVLSLLVIGWPLAVTLLLPKWSLGFMSCTAIYVAMLGWWRSIQTDRSIMRERAPFVITTSLIARSDFRSLPFLPMPASSTSLSSTSNWYPESALS